MDSFSRIVHRITKVVTAIGIVSLMGIMCIVVADIIFRLTGSAIKATFELVELLAVVTLATSVIYTSFSHGNIVIKFLFSRFTPLARAIIESITIFLTMGIWAAIGWATFVWIGDIARVGLEPTVLLRVPVLPFKVFWMVCISILCIIFLLDLFDALIRVRHRGENNES